LGLLFSRFLISLSSIQSNFSLSLVLSTPTPRHLDSRFNRFVCVAQRRERSDFDGPPGKCDRWSIWHLCVRPRTRRNRWRQRRRHRLLLMKCIDKVTKWTACFAFSVAICFTWQYRNRQSAYNHVILLCVAPLFYLPPTPQHLHSFG
jgi:hypothetical protein